MPDTIDGPPIQLSLMADADLPEIARLHADAFGPGRFTRAAYRVREGTIAISPHCRCAWRDQHLIGSVTMTEVRIGGQAGHWLLGPLAVKPHEANRGYGRLLVTTALQSVAKTGVPQATVILVGDLSYYERAGFKPVPFGQIVMPAPVDPTRLLIWCGPDGDRVIPTGAVRAA